MAQQLRSFIRALTNHCDYFTALISDPEGRLTARLATILCTQYSMQNRASRFERYLARPIVRPFRETPKPYWKRNYSRFRLWPLTQSITATESTDFATAQAFDRRRSFCDCRVCTMRTR